jgi:hypothetical protein
VIAPQILLLVSTVNSAPSTPRPNKRPMNIYLCFKPGYDDYARVRATAQRGACEGNGIKRTFRRFLSCPALIDQCMTHVHLTPLLCLYSDLHISASFLLLSHACYGVVPLLPYYSTERLCQWLISEGNVSAATSPGKEDNKD